MSRMPESHLWKERIVILIYLYCFLILTLSLWLWLWPFSTFSFGYDYGPSLLWMMVGTTVHEYIQLFKRMHILLGLNAYLTWIECISYLDWMHILRGLNAHPSWNVLNSRNHMSSHMDQTMDMEPLKKGKNHRMHQEMFVDPTLSVTTKDSWDGYECSLSLSLSVVPLSASLSLSIALTSLSLALFCVHH